MVNSGWLNKTNSAPQKKPCHFEKVLVIGLGEIGINVAGYVKKHGFDTYGYDMNKEKMTLAKKIGIKKAINFRDFDVYIICVSTHDPNDVSRPQMDSVFSIAKKLSKEGKEGALVAIESTVSIGVTRKVCTLLSHRMHVIHAGHRFYNEEKEIHGVNQLRLMGGIYDCCLSSGLEFYSGQDIHGNHNHLGIPMHTVSSVEVSELSRIVENSYRYLQIAFAEELFLICKEHAIDFEELRKAANTKWNIQILEARDGIRGHCLPACARMYIQSAKSIEARLLQNAVNTDKIYRQRIKRLER
jgi:UDP-N-acetyl-D-mannosaminuronate dehydrogenase